MADTFDVAKWITERLGEVTSMKLQKLMYYSQAWYMVWEEEPLFEDDFQAWANGPVLPNLYNFHRGMFKVNPELFTHANSENLSARQKECINKVLEFYGDKTAQWLSNLTHQEVPWLSARGDSPIGAVSTQVIPKAAMHEYYSSL